MGFLNSLGNVSFSNVTALEPEGPAFAVRGRMRDMAAREVGFQMRVALKEDVVDGENRVVVDRMEWLWS